MHRDVGVTTSEPKVWIISVNLNDLPGLRRTAWSVAGQQDVNLIHLAVDGGSTDGSVDWCTERSRREANFRFMPGPDSGIYSAMNRALRVVPPDALVWYLNAGDFFTHPRVVAEALLALGKAEWVGGPLLAIRQTGRLLYATAPASGRWLPSQGLFDVPPQPTVLARKSAIDAAGGFREDLRLASDGILLQTLASENVPAQYSRPGVAFMLGGRSAKHFSRTLAEFRTVHRPPREGLGLWRRDLSLRARTALRTLMCDAEESQHVIRAKLSRVALDYYAFRRRSSSLEPHWNHFREDSADFTCCISLE
jgi:hypothetical protein